MIPFSVLDLAPITQGGTPAESFRNSLELARHAEKLGYERFWLAEHHNIPSVASSATAVLIAHIAAGTSRIRVGAGGIMLPNHSPLVIAEQFGTLESLYPGRIDLGLGRAPGGGNSLISSTMPALIISACSLLSFRTASEYSKWQRLLSVPASSATIPADTRGIGGQANHSQATVQSNPTFPPCNYL